MKDYQNRVFQERAELQVKINRLENFLEQGESPTLSLSGKEKMLDEERSLMEEQYRVMEMYLTLLTKRIELFNNVPSSAPKPKG